tara:strand:+ start:183 stop:554 length:372 start_codon:yes stop_codon:yes gene_type:complete
MTILLVDDDELICQSIGDFLSQRQHTVFTCTNGQDALDYLDQHTIDLIISDIYMPGIDGIELLRQIRARYPTLQVILITGHATVDTAVEALRNRAYDYLRKPIRLEELLTCIKRIENRNGTYP